MKTSVRLIALLVAVCVFFPGVGLAAEPTLEESATLLMKRRKPKDKEENEAARAVLDRAEHEPAFRTDLIKLLTDRLKSYSEPYKGEQETRALRELRAVEALPMLIERWNAVPKKTHYLAEADPRVQLLETIAALQTGDARREFLIAALDDEAEAAKVRLHAHIAICATGDPAGIAHLRATYERDCKEYPVTMYPGAYEPEKPQPQKWDTDGDGLSDYAEKGLLLDPGLADTDGDGIPDGNDRNPLTAPAGELSENQRVAQYLLYMYAKYLAYTPDEVIGRHNSVGPPPFLYIVSKTNRSWDSTDTPGLLAGVEVPGINGIILSMDPDQSERYNMLHGGSHTPKVSIHCISDLESEELREMFLRFENVEPGAKAWHFSESRADGGVREGKLMGNARTWHIQVKKFGDMWLPICWELRMIT